MAARRPRHRRWWVRRRRFPNAQGDQVTDIWLNLPLLPRRIVIISWRSPYFWTWHIQYSPSPVGVVLPAVLLLVASVWDLFRHVGTSQLVAGIPEALMILGALAILTVLGVQTTHRPR